MKKSITTFLQIVIILIGLGVLAFMLWEPQLEGRNANATFSQIYFHDPFLVYAYISSLAFFTILYQAFKISSKPTAKSFRTIKYSAIVLSILIVMAGIYIRAFHAADDDPAGFMAVCIVATFISIVIATVAAKFEKRYKSINN